MDWFLYDNGLCHERVKVINPFHATDLFSGGIKRDQWHEMG